MAINPEKDSELVVELPFSGRISKGIWVTQVIASGELFEFTTGIKLRKVVIYIKKIIKWTVIGFIGLMVLATWGIMVSASKNPSNTTKNLMANDRITNTPVPPTPTPEPMKISAKDLADSFDQNQVAAEQQWKGKLVEFSASISNITDSGISFSNVASKEFSFTQISCRIKDRQQLIPLKNGETISVRGIVGKQSIGVIDINPCEVVL